MRTSTFPLVPEDQSRHRKATGYARRALIADVVMLTAGSLIVAAISPTPAPTGTVPTEPVLWSLGFSLVVVGLFALQGMYSPPWRLDALDCLRVVISQTALAAILVMAARVVLTNDTYVAAQTVRHWVPATLLVAMGRVAVLLWESRARRQGNASRPTLVVGAGKVGRLAAARLLAEPELGQRPVAFLDDAPLDGDDATADLPVLPLNADLETVVNEFGVSHIIIAFSMTRHDTLLKLSRRAGELGLTISMIPRLFELEGERVAANHLGGLPLVAIRRVDPRGWQIRAKYALDRVLSGIMLLFLAPVLAIAALAVRISLGRPVLFRQRRVGLDGTEFDMLKFRTLAKPPQGGEADAEWAAEQLGGTSVTTAAPLGVRLTPVGWFLRRHCLDELPQLWNVLRGDMSLVGPRPERTAYVQHFSPEIYRYSDRHRVKSGVTGWAQIHGLRGSTSLADRVEWDNHYIENWSLWMDFKIAMKTIPAVLRGTWTGPDPTESRERPA
jgi:exopolysaccharide biosynthesis polyprenyl glycosylphosphotransferase